MNRVSPYIWLSIVLFLILPSAAGRFFLDVAGGLILLFLSIPILIGGIGWLGWKLLKPQIKQCESCGTSFLNEISECPVCGSSISNSKIDNSNNTSPASSVIIDITANEDKEQ